MVFSRRHSHRLAVTGTVARGTPGQHRFMLLFQMIRMRKGIISF